MPAGDFDSASFDGSAGGFDVGEVAVPVTPPFPAGAYHSDVYVGYGSGRKKRKRLELLMLLIE